MMRSVMDYELAELEQQIKKQRQYLASLITYDAPDADILITQEREKLDDLYKSRIILSDKKEFEVVVMKWGRR